MSKGMEETQAAVAALEAALPGPSKINIVGIDYAVSYVDSPMDADPNRREAYWGSIDFWTRTIRIYRKDRTPNDILQTVIHEVLHGLREGLHIKALDAADSQQHRDLDLLATGLMDTLTRNGWLKEGLFK
jgi:hypothetical protein